MSKVAKNQNNKGNPQLLSLLIEAQKRIGCGCGGDGLCNQCRIVDFKIEKLIRGNSVEKGSRA